MNIIYYGGTDGLTMTQDNYPYLKEMVFTCWPVKESAINQTVAVWRIKHRRPVAGYVPIQHMRPTDWEKLEQGNNINC